ncbi:cytochrome c oxidase assembly factor Coa1 family protein [Massilia antarctica]|uniref:cytochrome c oxidase assembly factor Coa1 family protein n=1 Tax=Massilia antarctica TaxID=2765360 RepID=UPI0015E1A377|nr:cytochrome c oxidase assembly factor Coa1 family protein [Massilia sp. H27-R4]MCY0911875.1 cytochrome c oxidase assembly factor Coa1 family protein [Massilia sp. H27-R4]
MSKAKNKILIILLIFLLAYFSGYFFSKNSEAFLTAKNFIVNSPEARRELGEIIDVQLAPFGYELEFAGHSGSADFECKVIGALKKGNAYVKLKKDASGWKIISANIVVEGNNFRL